MCPMVRKVASDILHKWWIHPSWRIFLMAASIHGNPVLPSRKASHIFSASSPCLQWILRHIRLPSIRVKLLTLIINITFEGILSRQVELGRNRDQRNSARQEKKSPLLSIKHLTITQRLFSILTKYLWGGTVEELAVKQLTMHSGHRLLVIGTKRSCTVPQSANWQGAKIQIGREARRLWLQICIVYLSRARG